MSPTLVVISHSHLDREWYRTAEALRSRLVDAVDDVLDLVASDPDFVFTLDGQTVVLEDYLEIRPDRRAEVEAAVKAGRLAIGPWYVQPDGFIPAGESIVRNLLEGRLVGSAVGPPSRVGYLPDTFGHPTQLPLVLRGFDLDGFCFRRGADDTVIGLTSEFRWEASDGTSVLALYLAQGYGNAAFLPDDVDAAAQRLATGAAELLRLSSGDTVALMNGCDHTLPAEVGPVLARLADVSGATIRRGTVDDVVSAHLERLAELPTYRGELRGAAREALLPGVWSTRSHLKLDNARCEDELFGWAEPWAAVTTALGGRDERFGLRSARRELLKNHAHDSLCGTSIDPVHREMETRFLRVQELGQATAERALGLLSGAGTVRPGGWDDGVTLAVFNPNPYPVSGVVRHWFDADPPYAVVDGKPSNPPLLKAVLAAEGFEVDGRPARLVTRSNERLFTWSEADDDRAVEFTVADVPAFGWSEVRLTTSGPHDDEVDDGRTIGDAHLGVEVLADGTFALTRGDRHWAGLFALQDQGDRGDSYDFSPVGDPLSDAEVVSIERRRHCSGIESLTSVRRMHLPVALVSDDRSRREAETTPVTVTITVSVAPGLEHVECEVSVDNTARDHRLRLGFPLGVAAEVGLADNAFDVVRRSTTPPDGTGWSFPPPATFPMHGFVTAGGTGLAVSAPGLVEAELTPDGVAWVTLVRAVGLLSARMPERGPAGPTLRIPGGQVLRTTTAQVRLMAYDDADELPQRVRAARLGLRAVVAGDAPLVPAGRATIAVEPPTVVLTAVKPAEDGSGTVLRLWNPTEAPLRATLTYGLPHDGCESVRLDEQPDGGEVAITDDGIAVDVPARGVRTLRLPHPDGGVSA